MIVLKSLVFLYLGITSVMAEEMTGRICLGENHAKPYSEHTARLYLRINDSERIYFNNPYTGPVLAIEKMDKSKDHLVKVYFDEQVVVSWKLNFSKLQTNSVTIWRSAGAWRMEADEDTACK